VALVGDRLFVGLAKFEDDWLWHNGRVGSRPEFVCGCFGICVVEKMKDRMGSIIDGEESTAWCG
jgi:hypothetical protein